MAWMGVEIKVLLRAFPKLDQRGQSTVEYILVLGVVFSLGVALVNSRFLNDMLGEDAAFFTNYRKQLEYAYRHGAPLDLSAGRSDESSYDSFHETYYNIVRGQSRFFVSEGSYPNE